ncbi:unnamed protein product [marine sediment metagenome]|uniref:Uncharacterized protein n=1 Tax=marine sediment metagenome TaxID=412755 RepID=X1MPN0_9ZZZZ
MIGSKYGGPIKTDPTAKYEPTIMPANAWRRDPQQQAIILTFFTWTPTFLATLSFNPIAKNCQPIGLK